MEHYQHSSSVSGINNRNISSCSRVWTVDNKLFYSRTLCYNTVFSSGFGFLLLSFILFLMCWYETKLLKSNDRHVFFILVVRTKLFGATLSSPTEISPKDSNNRLLFAVDSTALESCLCSAINQRFISCCLWTCHKSAKERPVKVEQRRKEKLFQLNLGRLLNELVSD